MGARTPMSSSRPSPSAQAWRSVVCVCCPLFALGSRGHRGLKRQLVGSRGLTGWSRFERQSGPSGSSRRPHRIPPAYTSRFTEGTYGIRRFRGRHVGQHPHPYTGDLTDPVDLIRLLNAWGIGTVDLLAGGVPCQPFSRAGQSKIRSLVAMGARPERDRRAALWESFAS